MVSECLSFIVLKKKSEISFLIFGFGKYIKFYNCIARSQLRQVPKILCPIYLNYLRYLSYFATILHTPFLLLLPPGAIHDQHVKAVFRSRYVSSDFASPTIEGTVPTSHSKDMRSQDPLGCFKLCRLAGREDDRVCIWLDVEEEEQHLP